jgi:hypothetical protein
VGGLLAHALGRVPIAGAEATVAGLRLTAENLAGRRNKVGTVRVERANGKTDGKTATTEDDRTLSGPETTPWTRNSPSPVFLPYPEPMPPRELPVMLRMSDIRLDFRVNFFYREDFVYLYDELSSPGKKPSRSWGLPLKHPPD